MPYKNPEDKVNWNRKWRANNSEKARISSVKASKKWRNNNPEIARERMLRYTKKFHNAHPGYSTEQSRKWRENNREKSRELACAGQHRRRASKLGALVNSFDALTWSVMKKVYGGRCAYCKRKSRLTQDHIRPLSKGGDHALWNIAPACQSCNSKKWAN